MSRNTSAHIPYLTIRGPRLPKRFTFATALLLVAPVVLAAAENTGERVDLEQQEPAASKSSEESSSVQQAPNGSAARKKAAQKAAIAKKKAERSRTPRKKTERDNGLARDNGLTMEPGIVCKSIDGYEDYVQLPRRLLRRATKNFSCISVTVGFQTEKVDKAVEAHLTADGEVRRSGQTRQSCVHKKKMLEYQPRRAAPERVYLKSSISLKGLAAGDYDLTIILHDEIAKDSSVSQVIKFKVIPPKDPRKEPEGRQPHELDTLYLPFLQGYPD